MSYEEKAVYKAQICVKNAEEGFRNRVAEIAKELPETDIDDIPQMLERLMLEYDVIKDAREDLAYVEKHYGKSEEA